MKIVYSAVRFLYGKVLKRDWDMLPLLRIKSPHRLPTLLTPAEVKNVLSHVGPRPNYVLLFTLYSLGLRLNEALELQVHDIDRASMRIHIRHGKGAKERYVPLTVQEAMRRAAAASGINKKTRHITYASPQLRHPPARNGGQYPQYPAQGACECRDHHAVSAHDPAWP